MQKVDAGDHERGADQGAEACDDRGRYGGVAHRRGTGQVVAGETKKSEGHRVASGYALNALISYFFSQAFRAVQ
jgi:hypothetical protein